MEVMVQLASTVADAVLARTSGSPAAAAVVSELAAAGLALQVLNPGATDPVMRSYFRVVVSDGREGQEVVARLLALEGVEAAYLSPDAGLPQSLP